MDKYKSLKGIVELSGPGEMKKDSQSILVSLKSNFNYIFEL